MRLRYSRLEREHVGLLFVGMGIFCSIVGVFLNDARLRRLPQFPLNNGPGLTRVPPTK